MTTQSSPNMKMQVHVRQQDELTAVISARSWELVTATTAKKPVDAPKPPELLLGALGACMIAGITREAEAKGLVIDDIQVSTTAVRLMSPLPTLADFQVNVTVYSPEPEERLQPILAALEGNGTVTNVLKAGTAVTINHTIIHPQLTE